MTFKQINALSEDALLYNPKTWYRLLIAEVMTLTERSPKFKTCEVSQVASKGHPPGQSWDKHHEKEPCKRFWLRTSGR